MSWINAGGYVCEADGNGGQRYQHRRVAAEKIGRPLTADEVVHHVNGVRHDNRPENLVVLPSVRAHTQLGRGGRRVHFDRSGSTPNKWRADIADGDGGRIRLGRFPTEAEALAAVERARAARR